MAFKTRTKDEILNMTAAEAYNYYVEKFRSMGYTSKEAQTYATRQIQFWEDAKNKRDNAPESPGRAAGKQIVGNVGGGVATGMGYKVGSNIAEGKGILGDSGTSTTTTTTTNTGNAGVLGDGATQGSVGAQTTADGTVTLADGSTVQIVGQNADGTYMLSNGGSLTQEGTAVAPNGAAYSWSGPVAGAALAYQWADYWWNKSGGKEVIQGDGKRENYIDAAIDSNMLSGQFNIYARALFGKSIGHMLSGKHKDIYQRDAIRKFLKEKGMIDEEGNLDVNGVKFDLDTEVGYGEDGLIANKNDTLAINQPPNADPKAGILGRGSHARYQIDLTDPNAVNMSEITDPLAWALGGTDQKVKGDLAGFLTNALTNAGLDEKAGRQYIAGLGQKAGFADSNEMLNAARGNIQNSNLSGWEKAAETVGVEGAVNGPAQKASDPLGIGQGWIDPSHREAFLDYTKKKMQEWGGDPNARILDDRGYIIDPTAQKMHGLNQNTISRING